MTDAERIPANGDTGAERIPSNADTERMDVSREKPSTL